MINNVLINILSTVNFNVGSTSIKVNLWSVYEQKAHFKIPIDGPHYSIFFWCVGAFNLFIFNLNLIVIVLITCKGYN